MIPIEKGYEQALNMFFKEVELTLGTTISRLKLSDLWSASESAPSVKLSEFLKTVRCTVPNVAHIKADIQNRSLLIFSSMKAIETTRPSEQRIGRNFMRTRSLIH